MSKEITLQKYTPQQIKYMHIIADPTDKRIEEEIAKEIGVTRQTLYMWRQKDGFLDESYKILEKNVKSEFGGIFNALVKKAKEGDTQASKLILEVMGKVNNKSPINVDKGVFLVNWEKDETN